MAISSCGSAPVLRAGSSATPVPLAHRGATAGRGSSVTANCGGDLSRRSVSRLVAEASGSTAPERSRHRRRARARGRQWPSSSSEHVFVDERTDRHRLASFGRVGAWGGEYEVSSNSTSQWAAVGAHRRRHDRHVESAVAQPADSSRLLLHDYRSSSFGSCRWTLWMTCGRRYGAQVWETSEVIVADVGRWLTGCFVMARASISSARGWATISVRLGGRNRHAWAARTA